MGASPVSTVVTAPTADIGADSGGGEPWWTGEWTTPPREPIPAKAEIRPPKHARKPTPGQLARLDESFKARAEAALLSKSLADMEARGAEIGRRLEEKRSRRSRQRLYDERERIKREKRKAADEIEILERRAEQAAAELKNLEWLTFLQAEDEQFMRLVLELI